MLKYVRIIKENPYKLGFIDEESPKELEPLINEKLSQYKNPVHVDSEVKMNNIIIILELNPPKGESYNYEYIRHEKEQFQKYYRRIIEDIDNSEFYDLYL